MTRDDIIRMAQEANRYANDQTDDSYDWPFIRDERFASLVAEREREACAKVCDPEPSPPNEAYTVLNNKATMRRCAAAIRARGNT